MALHFDHDHHTHVSQFADNRATLQSIYRQGFPDGAVQPHGPR
jgi:hypothetical protein